MDSNRKENNFAALALAFVIGGLIGVTGLGLLLLPRKGRETREKIKEQGGESLEKPQDTVKDIWTEGKELAEAEKEKALLQIRYSVANLFHLPQETRRQGTLLQFPQAQSSGRRKPKTETPGDWLKLR